MSGAVKWGGGWTGSTGRDHIGVQNSDELPACVLQPEVDVPRLEVVRYALGLVAPQVFHSPGPVHLCCLPLHPRLELVVPVVQHPHRVPGAHPQSHPQARSHIVTQSHNHTVTHSLQCTCMWSVQDSSSSTPHRPAPTPCTWGTPTQSKHYSITQCIHIESVLYALGQHLGGVPRAM